jgi:hypothetical protein
MADELSYWYDDICIWKKDLLFDDKYIFLHLLKHLDVKYCLNTPEPEMEFDFELTRADIHALEEYFRFQFPGGNYPFKQLVELEMAKKNNEISRETYLKKMENLGVNNTFLHTLWFMLWNLHQSGYVDKYYNKFMIGEKRD